MKLIEEEKYNILKADEGKHIRGISDVYKPAYYDENNEYIEEYMPNYFTEAYVPKKITEENMHEKYIEEDI